MAKNFGGRSAGGLHGEHDTGPLAELAKATKHRVAQLQLAAQAAEERALHEP